jgi:hypothetical protein
VEPIQDSSTNFVNNSAEIVEIFANDLWILGATSRFSEINLKILEVNL